MIRLIFILIITVCVYWQVKTYDFVNYDDDMYILENPQVTAGLNKDSLRWAFTNSTISNWQPITFISHILTVQLFGLNPGKHHLMNLFFHLLNIALLFFILIKLTNSFWKASIVAFLFALHPLNVSTVAWIAERKGLLCTFFSFLMILSYIRYTISGKFYNYFFVIIFFILGLMSKASILILPLILLLLDYWPLNKDKSIKNCVIEKTPLFFLSTVFGISNLILQKSKFAIYANQGISAFSTNCLNALLAYFSYLKKLFLPFDLAIFYPITTKNSVLEYILSIFCLLAISAVVIKFRKQKPYLLFGWLWYVITFLPIIGFLKIGSGTSAMADRYAYIPFIGIYIALVWGINDILKNRSYKKIIISCIAALLVPILTIISYKQIQTWKNDISLYEHAIKVTKNNYLAYHNLGTALFKQDKKNIEQTIKHMKKAVDINPNYTEALCNLGILFGSQENFDEALRYYYKAIKIEPNYYRAHYGIGVILLKQRNFKESIKHLKKTLELNPEHAEARKYIYTATK